MNENVRQDNWINKGLRQHEGEEQRLLSGGNVSCLITEKRAVEYGKKKKEKKEKRPLTCCTSPAATLSSAAPGCVHYRQPS